MHWQTHKRGAQHYKMLKEQGKKIEAAIVIGADPATVFSAVDQVRTYAGSRPAKRDPVDVRIVRGAFDGSARIIDSQKEVGGYPSHDRTTSDISVPDAERREWLEELAKVVTMGE